MSTLIPDIIDHLAGIAPGSRLDEVRAQRPQARENAQKSYLALFEPEVPGNVSALERYAVATFVAGLHRQPAVTGFYALALQRLGRPDISDVIDAEILRGATEGPYGHYPKGPLSSEDDEGPDYRILPKHEAIIGPRLTAALHHAHLLVLHPRDASRDALQKLLDAGWSTTDIVTLSQLVSFLSFQIRLVAGLRVLAAAPAQKAEESDHAHLFTGLLATGTI